jgi:hypothetical protein
LATSRKDCDTGFYRFVKFKLENGQKLNSDLMITKSITKYKDITTDNPIREVWKNLRRFLDESFVIEEIRNVHSIKGNEHNYNIMKQAHQVNYCIRQAEEYFNASSSVSLTTRPLLLYYGAVSLSKALTLIRLDGNYSIDKLRETNKHKHHGLELKGSIKDAKPSFNIETFLSSLNCSIFIKDNKPWGHFSLFYDSLVPCAYLMRERIYYGDKDWQIEGYKVKSCSALLDIISISSISDGLSIIKNLPELRADLMAIGISPNICKGELWLQIEGEDDKKYEEEHNFLIEDVPEEYKESLLAHYKLDNPSISIDRNCYNQIHIKINKQNNKRTGIIIFPEIIDDLYNNKYYILVSDSYITEPASYFIILYCLGMLSRYYPDIWVSIIDKNINIAELTNTFLNLAYRKFPNLILDQMTLTKHYIHI